MLKIQLIARHLQKLLDATSVVDIDSDYVLLIMLFGQLVGIPQRGQELSNYRDAGDDLGQASWSFAWSWG